VIPTISPATMMVNQATAGMARSFLSGRFVR
jgi:hypothetical protein